MQNGTGYSPVPYVTETLQAERNPESMAGIADAWNWLRNDGLGHLLLNLLHVLLEKELVDVHHVDLATLDV